MLQLAKLLPYCLALSVQVTSSFGQRGDVSPLAPLDKVTTRIAIRDSIYGDRNVSYFTTNDGFAIIDGDVIYGTVDQLRSHDLRGNVKDARAFTTSSSGALWPNANLRYKYDSAATETLLAPIVNAAITRWTTGAPWLTFTQVANSNTGENGVVLIRATECGGCNAHIGYANAPRNMNLQQGCPANPGWCGVNEATHEFGHLLGFYHEHQRPTRESTVHYNCANLNPSCPTGVLMPAGKTCCDSGLPAGCCGTAGNFAIINSGTIDTAGPYDVGSLMQYRANAFALPGTNTLTPAAAGVVIPTNNPGNPSARDFNRLCKMYKNSCPAAQTCVQNDCPASCSIIKVCNNPILCNSDYAVPCCDPWDANQACEAQRALCNTLGCGFMTQ